MTAAVRKRSGGGWSDWRVRFFVCGWNVLDDMYTRGVWTGRPSPTHQSLTRISILYICVRTAALHPLVPRPGRADRGAAHLGVREIARFAVQLSIYRRPASIETAPPLPIHPHTHTHTQPPETAWPKSSQCTGGRWSGRASSPSPRCSCRPRPRPRRPGMVVRVHFM